MRRIEGPLLGLALLLAPTLTVQAALPSSTLPASAPTTSLPPSPQAQWATMSPQQQRQLRDRYAAWQSMPDGERQRVRQAAAALAALPEAERQALQERFQGIDQMQRDGWLLGPRLGALYAQLQPLFGYLPPAQREPVLAMLHQLDAAELEQLSRVSQRTPPQDRAALRTTLLGLTPAQRTAWLRQKVGQ
jgi:hypothetical protein